MDIVGFFELLASLVGSGEKKLIACFVYAAEDGRRGWGKRRERLTILVN